MKEDRQEQAYWLLLTFESGLSVRIINGIIDVWCKQLGRTLQEFFSVSSQEWTSTCHLKVEIIEKLERAKEKLSEQALLVEQLEHEHISLLTVLNGNYPALLKSSLDPTHRPPVLCYAGDLGILGRKAIAIIGSRNAGEQSLAFTREAAQYLAEHGANVISGNARGVDRAAYEGATSTEGCTTVVLPHGIRQLSKVQMRNLLLKIEAGNVLLMSQFPPDAPWVVSRAMERNKVVTGLAQIVLVAESDIKGGTWEGANGALKQERPVYVRRTTSSPSLPGNEALIERGGRPLLWPTESMAETLAPLLEESGLLQQKQHESTPAEQPSLFAHISEQ